MLYRRQDIIKIIKALYPKMADETIRKKWKAWKPLTTPVVQFENMAIYNDDMVKNFIDYIYEHSRIKQDTNPIVLERLLQAYCGIEAHENTDIRRHSGARERTEWLLVDDDGNKFKTWSKNGTIRAAKSDEK